MLPLLRSPDMAAAVSTSRAFSKTKESRMSRHRAQQAAFVEEEGLDHESSIPREYYVVETHAIPKYSNQYASVFNGSMWETVIFPSLHPHTRAEVLHLKDAMRKMEAKLHGAEPTVAYTAAHSEKEWAIYSLCFGELIRQMKFVCRDQSALLQEIQTCLDNIFQRVVATMKAVEAAAAMQAMAPVAPTPLPSSSCVVVEAAKQTEEPAVDSSDAADVDDASSETEEFICAFCYELCRDPKKESTRRSTLLDNIQMKRLSVDIGSDARKLKCIGKLQAVYRGYRVRKQQMHSTRIKQRLNAVLIIQRKFRGYLECKRATNRRRVLAVWKKRANQLSAIQSLQRSARKFLKRSNTSKVNKLGDVLGAFKRSDAEVAEKIQQKAQEVARLTESMQVYHAQVRGIEELLESDEPVSADDDKDDDAAAAAQEEGEAPHVPHADEPRFHLDMLCANVGRGLRMIHERASRMRARESQLELELVEARRRMSEMEFQAAAAAAAAATAVGREEEDDEDDWHLPQAADDDAGAGREDEISTARELIDSIKSIRTTRHWHMGSRRGSNASDIASSVHGDGTDSSAHTSRRQLHAPEEGHATASLLSRIRADSNVQSRAPRQLLWLKQLIVDIYDTLVAAAKEERGATPLHFALSLSPTEYLQVRELDSASNVCDTVYQHFQCHFGLPPLVDQAISDLAISVQAHATADDDVLLFQSFLNGARPKADLLFFCHVRSLCAGADDATHRVPALDPRSSHREVIDVPHALKLAHLLFRVNDVDGAAAQYDQFEALLRRCILHTSPLVRRIDAVFELVYFTDFFDLLCRVHADARLACLYALWVADRFEEIDLDGDGVISCDEFVRHVAQLPHAPTARELRQIFQHATYHMNKGVAPHMPFDVFKATMLRLLHTKQLQASHLHVGQNPALQRQIAHSIRVVHTIGRIWHEKKETLEMHLDTMFERCGLQRNLAAYLLHLRTQLEELLLAQPIVVETSVDAWDKYATIVCVLLALRAKREGLVHVAESHIAELEQVWLLKDKTDEPAKSNMVLVPLPVKAMRPQHAASERGMARRSRWTSL
ncbi:Aste57867_21216 [Aphanomyces stellatus]|uniref:Aste57867_21216 protein n=1 Tax=Aphanomyces stellatus TaxID=120398 RepID=A0A485LHM7_9STRA|nr:hypothetical protein As57867_021148 [Aphanomyces stellatus]VFT97888.1 Aste57867_21216 [Aphanomyces stellatus]